MDAARCSMEEMVIKIGAKVAGTLNYINPIRVKGELVAYSPLKTIAYVKVGAEVVSLWTSDIKRVSPFRQGVDK